MIKYLSLLLLLLSIQSFAETTGGGGEFGGGGAGGSWGDSSSESSSSSGSNSCSSDGWKFDYIVNGKVFESPDLACRYVWSESFLKSQGYKETRLPSGEFRGKYYREIFYPDDWSVGCYVNVGFLGSYYENNIGGFSTYWTVSKYYKGKVEICDSEKFPPIPNLPVPNPNPPSGGGTGGTGSSGGGSGGGTGGSGGGVSYNYNTYNYQWDITTNNTTNNEYQNVNHNTTINNTTDITEEKLTTLINIIKNSAPNVDLSSIEAKLDSINTSLLNLKNDEVIDFESQIDKIIQAIKDNKYDDAQLKQVLTDQSNQLNNTLQQIELNTRPKESTDSPESPEATPVDLDEVTKRQDEQTGVLASIRDLLKDIKELLKKDDEPPPDPNNPDDEVLPSHDPWGALKGFDISQNRINATAQCPADKTFQIMGQTMRLPYSYLCQFLALLAPIFLAMAYFAGARIIIKGLD